jgi:hypothetical protein
MAGSEQTNLKRKSWLGHLFILILLTGIGILIYGHSLQVGYLADDYDWLIFATSHEHSLLDPVTTAGTGTYFRPLIALSLQIEQRIGGNEAVVVHHLANLLFHLLSTALVYGISYPVNGRRRLSTLLAFLFLLHPAVVPSVFWISSRVDSLMTVFYLFGIYGFLCFLRNRCNLWGLCASAVGLAGALLAKEMAVTLVATLALLWLLFRIRAGDPFPKDAGRRRYLWGTLFLNLGVTVAYLLFLWTRFYRDGQASGLLRFGVQEIMETVVATTLLLFLPNNKSLLQQTYEQHPWLLALGFFLLLAGVALALWWLHNRHDTRSRRLVPLLLALWLAPLAPLFPTGVNTRRMYLPLAMVCIALAFVPALDRGDTGSSPDHEPGTLTRWLTRLLTLAMPVLAFASVIYGNVWVHNSRLTDAYCDSFRTLMTDSPTDTPILLLVAPGRARDVPLFSNDANPALYHCLTGEFGTFSRFLFLSQFRTESEVPGTFALDSPRPRTFELSTTAPSDSFFLWPGAGAGGKYEDEFLTIDVQEVRMTDRVSHFTVTFGDAAELAGVLLLSFEERQFKQVFSAGGEEN